MLEVLFFTFTNFWIFLGVFVLLCVVLNGIADIIRAFWGR